MTSRYRVEYALKSHRRDEFIEWIKALLAGPFVLHADIESFDSEFPELYDIPEDSDIYLKEHEKVIAKDCQRRYLEIFKDVENLIEHTILIDEINDKNPERNSTSRLRNLVPSLGRFFTPLPLTEAFLIEDERRAISKRRLVSPSFNDVRMILNTAQIMALTKIYKDKAKAHLKLITFDGDVTLYEDGQSLNENSAVVKRLINLLKLDLFVGVVTAAGYPNQSGAEKYHERLQGLIDYFNNPNCSLKDSQKENLLVMGAESNYLFRYNNEMKGLKFINSDEWLLPQVKSWDNDKITYIMDTIYQHLVHLRMKFNLEQSTTIIKKERSVGIIPNEGYKILREQLEEMVLSCSNKLNIILRGSRKSYSDSHEALIQLRDIKVCAFNGGSDVWVDIGDKALGVESLQKYLCQDSNSEFCPITKAESLHIGDQFASLGANDFKARLSACTVWIANPAETVAILDDLINYLE
ncbi:ISN1 [Candida jiufengensis]|uniref:ISN1 n=1 Tax=Candida jiufengensis TaxID=497108 RepID=UPI0022254292|nr:ISN1 [Candida jiufengensis]KAI5955752.1 ISN1 [Candida jiufengensis]